MAAPVTTTATSAEAQLFEVAGAIQQLELAEAETNPEFTPLLTLAIDAEANTVTITATLPATVTSTAGTLAFSPTPYL